MKKNLLKKYSVLSVIFLLTYTASWAGTVHLSCLARFSANINADIIIKGAVVDEAGVGIPGVSVAIKGTIKGVQTDVAGKFSIPVSDTSGSVLVFTFIGYERQEVAVAGRTSITVKLKPNVRQLNEVVAIGYGAIKRKDLTGSVSSVKASDLRDIPISSAADALAGRLAGVQVTSSEGAPGAETNIVIRGGGSITQSNAPLYVIDGIQVESGLSGLSPQDIESIDVLKDASSTAIYGARGANGVIVVTTKGGNIMKTTVTYNGTFGLNKLTKSLDVMNPYEFVVYQYERSRGNPADEESFGNNYGHSFDTLSVYHDSPGINWQHQMFGRNALMKTHNLAITGGTAATKFNISLTKNTQDGIMLNSNFDRNIANIKFEHTANTKLTTGFTLRASDQAVLGSGTSAGGFTQSSRLRQTIRYKPLIKNTLSIDDFDQAYYNETNALGNGVFLINPLALSKAEYQNAGITAFNLGGYVTYKVIPSLSFTSTASFDSNVSETDIFADVNTPLSIGSGLGLPIVSILNTNKRTIDFSNVLTFSNSTFKKNGFNKNNAYSVLLGQEIYEVSLQQGGNILREFPVGITADKALGQLNLGKTMSGYPTSLRSKNRLLSFFSRLNYTYKNKYLASFTLRADGSSKFAQDQRWGYFPSGALAWRLSEEDFMKKINFISEAKLRLSYGQSGNNRIGDFLYLQSFVSNVFPYGLNETLVPGYVATQLANAKLKWETTISKNIGLDLGLFGNRLQLSVDAYQNDVNDLLIPIPIPSNSGYTTQLQNVGSTRNTGIEFQLSGRIVSTKDFTWSSNFNIAFNKNTIKSLSNGMDYYLQGSGWGISGQPADFIVKVGSPVGAMYGYVTDGFYKPDDFNYDPATKIYKLKDGVANNAAVAGIPQPGSIKFKDLNGDNLVDSKNDRTIIGNNTPKFSGGLNQQFRYKNFDLSVFMNFVYGNKIMNANKIEFTNGYLRNNNMLNIMTDRWRTIDDQGNVIQSTTTVNGVGVATGEAPEVLAAANKDAKIWQPIKGTGAYTLHSWAIEDGSFLRINNITLGYSFSSRLLERIKIKKLRIYGTLNNVAVFTNYTGYDPEVSVINKTPVTPGVDYSAYPRNKAYLVGVNLTL
ncbi:TonB-dependent receptor [Mucilaginibacter sabulilitoris]|uniref:TonB-dependent receptor n=1 Tax=Mucilaginibacter sabulilitoris TaxID=1173583 RepID=A0ABZ0TQW0_9SPHI|nr:TonB-dependent receptor [Mucilaginibacter sabulilitoris]WPU95507.1 TonB-dependent receptor [Mucilaginibacter sabulilitoris]